jgi:hypothetical protein
MNGDSPGAPDTDSLQAAARREPRRTLGFFKNWWRGLLADITLMDTSAHLATRRRDLDTLIGPDDETPQPRPSGVPEAAWTGRVKRARALLLRLRVDPEEEAWIKARTAVDKRLMRIEAAIGLLVPGVRGAAEVAAQLVARTSLQTDNEELRHQLSLWASAWADDRRWREAQAAVSRRLSQVEELAAIEHDGLWLALERERQALPSPRRNRAAELARNRPTTGQPPPALDAERSEAELLLREAVRAGNDNLRARLLSMRSADPLHWRQTRSATSEGLFEIEAIMPLLAGDQELRLQLEMERHAEPRSLPKVLEPRADTLLKTPSNTELNREQRSEAELLVGAAVHARNDEARERQATAAARINYMTWMAIILAFTGVLTAGMIILAQTIADFWPNIFLVAAAGALGGTLSGLLTTIRAPWRTLVAIERLGPGAIIQPILGMAGGVVLYAIWQSGAFKIPTLKTDDWAAITAVAFAGGFSEPLLLKSVRRLTGSEDPKSVPAEATAEDRSAARGS